MYVNYGDLCRRGPDFIHKNLQNKFFVHKYDLIKGNRRRLVNNLNYFKYFWQVYAARNVYF